jgi:DNA-binding FrmR family transcriptional regulator/CheY-like chemotaxis protein
MEGEEPAGRLHLRRDPKQKRALLGRLARIEGQVRGLRQMIEEDRYTGEVIQQAAAVKAALREVAILCFQTHAEAGIALATSENRPHDVEVDTIMRDLTNLLRATLKHNPSDAGAERSPSGATEALPLQRRIEDLLKQEATNILLVEDDPVAAEILKTGLDSLGCSVTVAATGEDALDMLKREDCAVDWLLADVVLPGKVDGWTVGDEFRLRNPYGRAVFISAYEQKDLSRKPMGSAFLNKPVRPAQLMEVFRGLEAA